ncbi:MAG: gluconate 2-dehydrogenase subunit 3 family protein [Gemmatimonadaceae bacterium]
MSSPGSVSRREMIEVTAAALVTPLLATRPRPDLPDDGLPARFLTRAEYALLDELTEMIIPSDNHSPGARAARVAGHIDGRLAESLDARWQALWRSGLQGVDGLSRELNGKIFLQAAPAERVSVLIRMAAGELDPKTPMEVYFVELKRATVRGYYTSRIGIHADQEYKGNVYQPGEYAGLDAK